MILEICCCLCFEFQSHLEHRLPNKLAESRRSIQEICVSWHFLSAIWFVLSFGWQLQKMFRRIRSHTRHFVDSVAIITAYTVSKTIVSFFAGGPPSDWKHRRDNVRGETMTKMRKIDWSNDIQYGCNHINFLIRARSACRWLLVSCKYVAHLDAWLFSMAIFPNL